MSPCRSTTVTSHPDGVSSRRTSRSCIGLLMRVMRDMELPFEWMHWTIRHNPTISAWLMNDSDRLYRSRSSTVSRGVTRYVSSGAEGVGLFCVEAASNGVPGMVFKRIDTKHVHAGQP